MRAWLFLLLAPCAVLASSLPFVLAGPGPVPVLAKYSGGEVTDGGSIQGTVTIDPVPELAAFTIGKDEAVCGASKPNPRLVVDPATKGVKNVVVWIDGIEKGKALPKGMKAVIDQKNCQYEPHITIVPVKSHLYFVSSDPILHNVHMFQGTPEAPHSLSKDVFNQAMKDKNVPQMPVGKRVMRRPGFYYVRCDAGHTWMSAYVWVVEHPYYVLTDEKGAFQLDDVPAGDYTLRFWQENWKATPVKDAEGAVSGYNYGEPVLHNVRVTVKAGEKTAAVWKIPGK